MWVIFVCLNTIYRRVIIDYMHQYESDLVKKRVCCRLKRRRFWAAGVNDLYCVDQHDKLKVYGLALHMVNPLSVHDLHSD